MDTSQTSRQTSGSLAVNPEHEVDFLKEKLEHFKLVIHKLQEELQTQKIRKEGAETVSKLLQESKQELVLLKKKIRTYESVIRNLQSRLERHGLSSEMTLQEGEQFLPGHSRQLLENLTRENKRLRNIIRNETGDPEEIVRLQKQCQDLLSELEETRTQHQTRVTELEGLLQASDNEKDVTITTLRADLERMREELRARDGQCKSLAQETKSLQHQLTGVAEQCQELARKLQDKAPETPSQEVKQPDNKKAPVEIEVLERKLKEVTEMNMRWQMYDKQREANMKQLKQELAELQKSAGTSPGVRDAQVEMNRVLDKAREDVAKISTELAKTKRDLDSANKDRAAMRTEIGRLRQRLGGPTGNDAEETIQALKAQIQICTEDFESERKDREKAQNRLAKQEAELDKLRRENEALKRGQAPVAGGEYNDPFYHYHGMQGGYGHEGLAARGVSARGNVAQQRHIDKYNVIDGAKVQSDGEDDATRKRRDESDVIRDRFPPEKMAKEDISDKNTDEKYQSLRTSSLSSSGKDTSPPPSHSQGRSLTSSPVAVTSIPTLQDDSDDGRSPGEILRCPKCGNEFTTSEHFEMLEHIEMCCE